MCVFSHDGVIVYVCVYVYVYVCILVTVCVRILRVTVSVCSLCLWQVVLEVLTFCRSPSDAVNAPRLHHQLVPMHISGEPDYSVAHREYLKQVHMSLF